MCNVTPSANFKLLIKPIAYPCANAAKKLSAEKKILGLVNKEKTLQKQREARQEDEHQRLKVVAEVQAPVIAINILAVRLGGLRAPVGNEVISHHPSSSEPKN